jgi:hypothetical protein
VLGAMDFGVADDGERAGREQAAQIAIASFADIAEPAFRSSLALCRTFVVGTFVGKKTAPRSSY